MTLLESLEYAIEQIKEGTYKILYISLSPTDYIELGNELRAMNDVFGQIEKLYNIPVYMDVTKESHLVMVLTNYVERKFLNQRIRKKR